MRCAKPRRDVLQGAQRLGQLEPDRDEFVERKGRARTVSMPVTSRGSGVS